MAQIYAKCHICGRHVGTYNRVRRPNEDKTGYEDVQILDGHYADPYAWCPGSGQVGIILPVGK